MDAQYLKDNVGDVLATGLANMILHNPADQIEYLGFWLIHFVENQKRQNQKKEEEEKSRSSDEEFSQQQNQIEADKKSKIENETQTKLLKEVNISNLLSNHFDDFDSVMDAFIATLKDATNASSVYVGEKEGEIIRYINATEDNKFMIDQTVNKGTGITFDLFEKKKKEDEEEERHDDEEDDDEEKKKIT